MQRRRFEGVELRGLREVENGMKSMRMMGWKYEF
jgi:hypothetical protein